VFQRRQRGKSADHEATQRPGEVAAVIPVSEPLLDERALAYVQEAASSGWISSGGRFIGEFERTWARYCGVAHGVAVCNGTVALELAMAALALPAGSEVILPSFTIVSCVAAVLRTGCRPVLVDCKPDTWCLDVAEVERKITHKTRAIMPVHIYGHMADMNPLMKLADRSRLAVIEDAAEAHGAEYFGRRAGGIGTVGCFSFYANKIITTGEGGMLVTDDANLAERARSLRNLCFRRDQRFLHSELGYNFRITNLQAAIGLAQVERIEDHLSRKRRMAALYNERLREIGGLILPVELPGVKNVYWMYGVVLDESVPFDARALAARLRERGIDSRPFFLGMHEQPVFHERGLFVGESYPVTERIAQRGLYLPSGLKLSKAEIDTVCAAVQKCLS
jgi:perosamine synthetase